MTFDFCISADSSRRFKNLYTMSLRDLDARLPVEYTDIHVSGTVYNIAAQKMATEVVLPQRLGVLMRVN